MLQPLAVLSGEPVPSVAQRALLGDQLVDVLENRLVVHAVQLCLVRPRSGKRSREWYSSFGSWPVARAIRLVKLYIEAISATSQTSSLVSPAFSSATRSSSPMRCGSAVSFSANSQIVARRSSSPAWRQLVAM